MKENTDRLLTDFLYHRVEPFTMAELLKFLSEPNDPESRENLSSYMLYNQLAYVNPSADGKKESWITRAGLFANSQSFIVPTRQEIASGILVPGSRFVPYVNPVLLPHELHFVFNSRTLSRTLVNMSTSILFPFYCFFGEEYTGQYLAQDNEKNEEIFLTNEYDDPDECFVSAINMKEVYWTTAFKPGDMICAQIRDWHNGVIELSIVPAIKIDKTLQEEWMLLMDESLIAVFELFGPGASMDEQLAFAFYLNQSLLSETNSVSLHSFLEWSKKIGIQPYGVESRLWYKNTEIPAQGTWNLAIVVAPTTLAEEAFMQLGLPVSDAVMNAYLMDALFQREASEGPVLKRLVPVHDKKTIFYFPVIERSVASTLSILREKYNWFADHEHGTIRNRFIDLHTGLTVFIFQLQKTGITPNQIPDQGAVVLGQLLAHTISVLELLASQEAPNSSEIETLWMSVEGMEDSFFEMKTAIQGNLPSLLKNRFSVIKEREEPNE
ncbi:MAG TPA: hypothetical protein GXZ47_02150 [Treponema sp.]|nr:hypothetical protein [Treponema sp.]